VIREDTVTVNSLDDLASLLDRMVDPVLRPQMSTQRWQGVIDFLEEVEKRLFAEERSPDGDSWPELSEWTKRAKGHGIKLVETMLLIDSMTNSSGQHAIRDTGQDELFFGTNRPWAAVHQDGSGDVPQREFAGLGGDDLESVVDLIADAAVEMMFEVT
jgi:phage gpG-like protein